MFLLSNNVCVNAMRQKKEKTHHTTLTKFFVYSCSKKGDCNEHMEGGSTKKRAREPREEDVIGSKLPESVITRILSLLPTKEAVRTCVLSKSWIDRWKSITNLQLDDTDLCNYTNICTFCKTECISCFY